jgi:hypothetical protein
VTGVTFRSITDAPPLVIVEVDVSFSPTTLGTAQGIQPYQLRETGQFTFNKTFQIVSLDLLIPYLDTAMALAGVDLSNPAVADSLIQGVCEKAAASCSQQSTQYTSTRRLRGFLSVITGWHL